MIKDFFSRKFRYYALNIETGNLLELFLVFAVASLLIVRIFLELAGYPVIGGGSFHIAHMLWGGFLMMAAIFLLLAFLNKQAKQMAAIVGGVGFGMFIDELGKFITKNNNYFYQPAVALIYVIFVLLFFLMRAAEKRITLSQTEYAVNAVEEVKELIVDQLDETERQKILRLLQQSDPNNILVQNLKLVMVNIKGRTDLTIGLFGWIKNFLKFIYAKIILTELFSQFLVVFFVIFALLGLVRSVADFRGGVNFADWGEFICASLAFGLVVRAVLYLRDFNRFKAYQAFKNAVLVSLFLTQFFMFVKDQLSALFGLLISVAAFIACQYLITQEEAAAKPGYTPASS